jgi:hypothetical protein
MDVFLRQILIIYKFVEDNIGPWIKILLRKSSLFLSCLRPWFGQQAGNPLKLQPPLILWTLVFRVDQPVEVAQVMEVDLSILHANESAVVFFFLALFDQIVQTQTRQAGCLDPVKRRGIAALL